MKSQNRYEDIRKEVYFIEKHYDEFQVLMEKMIYLKRQLDRACGRVMLLTSEIKQEAEAQIRNNLGEGGLKASGKLMVGNPNLPKLGLPGAGKSIIDSLVEVLMTSKRWMSIQELTRAALDMGVTTTSPNADRVFSSALSGERGKPSPKVRLHEGRWGLPHWDTKSRESDRE